MKTFVHNLSISPRRHPREGGDPDVRVVKLSAYAQWNCKTFGLINNALYVSRIPAFAGMTVVIGNTKS